MAAAWTKGTWTGWSVMTFLVIGTAGYAAFAMIASIVGEFPPMMHHFPDRAIAAAVHFGVGGLALLIGPFQFLPGMRAKRPVLHRWMGRVYVVGCLASAIAALVLTTDTLTGPVARVGFSLLAGFWIVTTSMAFLKAWQKDFSAHRRWMIRSYALTLAAVTLRIYLPTSLALLQIPFAIAYPLISYACWVPNAIVAEWMIRR